MKTNSWSRKNKLTNKSYIEETNLVGANEVQMESSESTNKPESNETIHKKPQRSRRVFESLPDCWITLVHEKLDVQG